MMPLALPLAAPIGAAGAGLGYFAAEVTPAARNSILQGEADLHGHLIVADFPCSISPRIWVTSNQRR